MENGLLSIPKERKLKPAFVLALVVHLVLVAFLWIGVSWQADTGDMVEAEVWDIKVREAAPLAAGERSAMAAAQQAEQPVAAGSPAIAAEQEASAPAADTRPDIALEQEKKRAEEKEAGAKKRADELKRQQEEQAILKKEADDAKKKQKADAAAAKRAKVLLDQEAKRIAGGGSGGGTATSGPTGSGGSGTSPYSTGPGKADAGYIRKVAAKIKSNTSFNVPVSLAGNPPVVYDVQLLPDGTLRNIRKRKSSGVAGFDEAVLRAIEKSVPYPRDQSGRVPSGFTLTHKPKG